MTPEAQRIAIAEACGWRKHVNHGAAGGFFWTHKTEGGARTEWDFPDYLNDLNAMHEAEKGLKEDQHWSYINELVALTGAEWTDAYEEVMVVAHATAAQRAEALLRTLGKWEEGK